MSSSVALQDLAALRLRAQGQATLFRMEGPDRVSVNISTASAGDHHQIHSLLVNVFHAPTGAEFQAQLDDPTYEPINRLVVRRSGQIVSHCRLIERAVSFGPLQVSATEIADLATPQEYRGRGYGSSLMNAIDQRLQNDGVQFGVLNTDRPEFYERFGWTEAIAPSYSMARARDILAHLSAVRAAQPVASPLDRADEEKCLTIRLWRHVELDALIRIYAQSLSGSYGQTLRTDAHWQWLITRRGFDRILIAIEGAGKLQLEESSTRILGYAAMSGSRIIEIMASGENRDRVRHELLARACRDAIERDDEMVRLQAPPNHALHRLFVEAGGGFCPRNIERPVVTMAKSYEPIKLLERMRPLFYDRAKARGLPRPTELGLQIGRERYCLGLMPRSVKLLEGKLARSYLTCSKQEFDRLLLGYGDVAQAVAEGRIEASTQIAVKTASALFPMLPFWRPPLEDLPA